MLDSERLARDRVVAVARSFIGTPYHDCAKLKGIGVDCATSIALIFVEAGLEQDIPIPAYSPQWYLHKDAELYLQFVEQYAREIEADKAQPGDLVLYKFGRCFAHGGIIVDPGFPAIVHAYKQAGRVVLGEGDSGVLAFEAIKGKMKPRARRFFSHRSWGG